MEFKSNSFDSPTPTPKSTKKTLKCRNRSSQTEAHIVIKKKSSVSDLVLGPSPSGTPSKNQSPEQVTSNSKISPNHEDYATKHLCNAESSPQAASSSPPCADIMEIPCENIPVIQKDMDAMSINFETPYLSSHKRVQRKLSLPQIKILKKNSSQESDSPPDHSQSASGSKKFFSGSSNSSSSSSRFLSTLKKRKHALKRALSFQNSSTSSEEKAASADLESSEKPKSDDDPNTL